MKLEREIFEEIEKDETNKEKARIEELKKELKTLKGEKNYFAVDR